MSVQRPCSYPGCPQLVAGKPRCQEHTTQSMRAIDQFRGTSVERGYDKYHRRLRILCFERDGWRCVDCGWEPNIVTAFREAGLDILPTEIVLAELRGRKNRSERHLHADHELPIAERPDLRLDLDNLRTRCNSCHAAKTNRETVRRGR